MLGLICLFLGLVVKVGFMFLGVVILFVIWWFSF